MLALRLTGKDSDVAVLRTLAEAAPTLTNGAWFDLALADGGYGIASPGFNADIAERLAKAGLTLQETDRPCARKASSLLEVVRPIPIPGDATADVACLWVDTENGVAERVLARLLHLGRDDVSLSEHLDGERRVLLVNIARPPLYLLMRARDEVDSGVVAFVRGEDETKSQPRLWVEWGYRHPLGAVAARALPAGKRAFVTRDGTFRYAEEPRSWHSIYDAIETRLDGSAVPTTLVASPAITRFPIRLRLGIGPEQEPELWLFGRERLVRLEAFLATASADEIARVTLSRVAARDNEPFYVLREMVRPGSSRLGPRISDLLSLRGYARVSGTDNLYLRTGKRLLPLVRRDDLRRLLGLDRAALVAVDDEDGLRVTTVRTLEEAPLSSFVEYLAMDHRAELDRLLETSVFDFPELRVERSSSQEEAARPSIDPLSEVDRERRESREPKAPREPKKDAPRPVPQGESASFAAESDERARAMARIHELELVVAEGGVSSAAVWQELGELKTTVGDLHGGVFCLEAALFHGADVKRILPLVTKSRSTLLTASTEIEGLLDLALRATLSPSEAGLLGARIMELVVHGEAVFEALLQQVEKVFSADDLPLSRRFVWSVLATLKRRTRDVLGITRAKERILGQLNTAGLHPVNDLPGFVRLALAIDGGDNTQGSTSEQLPALESLFRRVAPTLRELDVLSGYIRLIFAIGFVRLGVNSIARDLVAPVEAEIVVHEIPNAVLFRLYLARLAHTATGSRDEGAWMRDAEGILDMAQLSPEPERGVVRSDTNHHRNWLVVDWLRRRSTWLSSPREEPPIRLNGELERVVLDAESGGDPAQAFARAIPLCVHDYEVTTVLSRTLVAALRRGSDPILEEVLAMGVQRLAPMRILGHRAVAVGACIRAAAALGDAVRVDSLLDTITTMVAEENAPPASDLLRAIEPGLLALRRLGASASAQRFVESLEPLASVDDQGRSSVSVGAALAEAWQRLGRPDRAEALLDQALSRLLSHVPDHRDRYAGAAAILSSLRHFPLAERLPRCERLLDQLSLFRDAFTTTTFYETHKILVLERLVDAIVDEATFRTERARAFLDAEEQVIRSQIIHDWNEICGP